MGYDRIAAALSCAIISSIVYFFLYYQFVYSKWDGIGTSWFYMELWNLGLLLYMSFFAALSFMLVASTDSEQSFALLTDLIFAVFYFGCIEVGIPMLRKSMDTPPKFDSFPIEVVLTYQRQMVQAGFHTRPKSRI